MGKSKSAAETNIRPPAKPHASTASASSKNIKDKPEIDFAFGRINYIYMVTGVLFILVGFLLMSGGRSSDPSVFNPEIFNFRRITLAPILVMTGFIIEVYAIVKKAED